MSSRRKSACRERGGEGFGASFASRRPSTVSKFHSCDDVQQVDATFSGSTVARAEGRFERGAFANPLFQPRSLKAQ